VLREKESQETRCQMSEEATLLDAVTVLIERGIYKDREALMHDAVRALLRSKPELRGQLAVALYERGDISLTRAAEIGGLDIESCKELLREAGVARRISPIGQEVQREEQQLLRAREAE
jgi:predicted HTH domain antitoxin